MPNLMPLLPEIVLAVGAMALLLVGGFRRKDGFALVNGLSMGLLLFAFFALVALVPRPATVLDGMFVSDGFALFLKTLVLFGSAFVLAMSGDYLRERWAC